MSRFRLVERDFAAEEVGDHGAVPFLDEAVGDLLDLIVDPPPLLDDDDAGRSVDTSRLHLVGGRILPVRALKSNHLSHRLSSLSVNSPVSGG